MVDDDVILEQVEFTYDGAGNVIETFTRRRYHNAPDSQTGPLADPSTTPKARVTYVASYPDPLGRVIATAEYGTNGGTALTRSATVPARSDNVLVTTTQYDSAGRVASTTNAAGVSTCLEYDAAGRQTKVVLNCASGSSSSSSSGSSSGCAASDDVNVTVLTAYNGDGNVSSITANNGSTGNQTTQFVYGTTLADSDIASSLLKVAEIYPDSVDGHRRRSQV